MRISSLNINEWQNYEPGYRKDSYRATIKYKGSSGEVMINLTPELTKKVMHVIADELVAASKEIANDLTREIIEQNLALPAASAA